MEKARWLTDSEAMAWRSLQFMHMQMDAALASQLAESSSLSYPDYQVLVALTDQPDDRLRLFELAKILGWEKSRLSHQISRMTDRALVRKTLCGDDRRGAYVTVTSKGAAELESAAPGHVETVRRLFVDRLSGRQLETIAKVAETVLAALVEESNAR